MPPADRPHRHRHRRDFVRSLALGASSVALTGGAGLAEPEKRDEANPTPAPVTEAEARLGLVLARFGKQLDDDARASIRAEVEGQVRRAEALRKVTLDNGDGPFPVFHPYRAALEDGGPGA